MPTTIAIRNARSADLEPLADLLKMLFSIEADFSVERSKQLDGLRMMLGNPRASILVADHDGEVVGMCTGQIVISTAEGGPSILVEDVVVRKDFQGQGIGLMLMKGIYDFAKKNRATRLQLLADCDNSTALEFYDKIGWERTSLICLRKKHSV
ncbi:GNAT family N-acetyltransferase [Maridesulfovibrio zosterae]|uniref:GNAT family N-acetyltransferase n=1 Tax=Maridesulfovibrio zosterae TaxID=82171 RepID=UPI0004221DA4|nr:GNAT family N-acetyltransferase [Maridesulfovibrio zosterae]